MENVIFTEFSVILTMMILSELEYAGIPYDNSDIIKKPGE